MGRATILRVGLTGNIGAGKSEVADVLREGGCLVLDADDLARRLLEPGTTAAAEIVAAFGARVRGPAGGVDRAALAAVVFGDEGARRRLEAITHPRIRDLEERLVQDWDAKRGIAVTEAALLVETGGADRYHRLVVVTAPPEVRLGRLIDKGMAEDDARARMRAQMAEADKRAHADYVVDAGGSLEETRRQAETLLERLREDLRALACGTDLPPVPRTAARG